MRYFMNERISEWTNETYFRIYAYCFLPLAHTCLCSFSSSRGTVFLHPLPSRATIWGVTSGGPEGDLVCRRTAGSFVTGTPAGQRRRLHGFLQEPQPWAHSRVLDFPTPASPASGEAVRVSVLGSSPTSSTSFPPPGQRNPCLSKNCSYSEFLTPVKLVVDSISCTSPDPN